jgi:hypothetical protein
MDPQFFLRINDFATELIKNERSGKYTPIEAAQWLEDYADAAAKYLSLAESTSTGKERPEFRRMSIDIAITVGLGRFFASKFRSGVLFGIFEQSGDYSALKESLNYYKKARNFWAELANRARDVYKPDITIGENLVIRGHWLDRLPAIDEDITFMTRMVEQSQSNVTSIQDNVRLAIFESKGRPVREIRVCHHIQPQGFRAGQALDIEVSFERTPASAYLYYRHVNHAERYEKTEMHIHGSGYLSTIPAAYTDSEYPVQYYIELKDGADKAWLYPGFSEDLANQPYFVVNRI